MCRIKTLRKSNDWKIMYMLTVSCMLIPPKIPENDKSNIEPKLESQPMKNAKEEESLI